jgi:hypothetical protein
VNCGSRAISLSWTSANVFLSDDPLVLFCIMTQDPSQQVERRKK